MCREWRAMVTVVSTRPDDPVLVPYEPAFHGWRGSLGVPSALTGARGRIGGVEPVVAVGAEAPERAEPEGGEVAFMRYDMIGDGRRHDAAGFQAKRAQWLDT